MTKNVFTAKFSVLLVALFLCGIFISILKYNGFFLSSTTEGKEFNSRLITSLKSGASAPVPFKELVHGTWGQVCIFVADASYPESARESVVSFLQERGKPYQDDKKDFPVIFLLVSDTDFRAIRLNRRYVSIEERKYIFYSGTDGAIGRHQGCLDYNDAALSVLNKEKNSELILTSNSQ